MSPLFLFNCTPIKAVLFPKCTVLTNYTYITILQILRMFYEFLVYLTFSHTFQM